MAIWTKNRTKIVHSIDGYFDKQFDTMINQHIPTEKRFFYILQKYLMVCQAFLHIIDWYLTGNLSNSLWLYEQTIGQSFGHAIDGYFEK